MPAASPPPAPPAPPPATRPQQAPVAAAAELKPRQSFAPPPPPPPPPGPARGPANLGPVASLASQAAVRDHPLVKQAVEAFSARIIDVREPTTDTPV